MTSSDSVRTHDIEIYVAENRYDEPKEITRQLVSMVEKSGRIQADSQVVDVGCAAGEFLYYMKKVLPQAQYLGLDFLEQLLEKARDKVPGVVFKQGSVLEENALPKDFADILFLQGVHSIFDTYEEWLDNIISWSKPGGKIYVFGPFNSHPIDVWVKYRPANAPESQPREKGWNMISEATIGRAIDERLGPGQYTFTPFQMPKDLEPKSDDCVRSWTEKREDGQRFFTNGLSLIINLQVLEINVPKK